MKKLFILLLSALALTAVAQQPTEVKRVAILETVDKEDKIVYGTELMLRTALATSITNTKGYEGYDRVDLKQITGEQSFQRTGMVSDDDIKKIGVMTGAQYVLVAEAAQIDATHVIITAKILDVETARLTNSAYQLMGTNSDELQNGCRKLADSLLGLSSTYSIPSQMQGECKVGIVNTTEIFAQMPEIAEVQKKMDEVQASYEKVYGEMTTEYEQLFQTYQNNSANWPSSKKLQAEKTLKEYQQRMQLFIDTATSDIKNKQNELLKPIQEKLENAIKTVGKKKGYMFIFDASASNYMDSNLQPEFENLNNDILKELNIKP